MRAPGWVPVTHSSFSLSVDWLQFWNHVPRGGGPWCSDLHLDSLTRVIIRTPRLYVSLTHLEARRTSRTLFTFSTLDTLKAIGKVTQRHMPPLLSSYITFRLENKKKWPFLWDYIHFQAAQDKSGPILTCGPGGPWAPLLPSGPGAP